jgi:hypothetical protein
MSWICGGGCVDGKKLEEIEREVCFMTIEFGNDDAPAS